MRLPIAVARLLALAAAALLAGCGQQGVRAVVAAAERPVEATASPSPTYSADPVPQLAVALPAAASWSGTATYALRARGGTTAEVTVTRAADKVRVDVATGGTTSSLMTADAGWVACAQAETCVTVAPPGAALPDAWDPGVGRLLTTVVPSLAQRDRGIYADGYLVAGSGLPAAACVEVIAPDSGRYCVTEDGLLRRAKFTGGTLTLTAANPTADPARFAPPVAPTPLG